MDNQLSEQMLNKIKEMKSNKGKSTNKYFKRIDFDFLERLWDRLNGYSDNCSICMELIPQINSLIEYIYSNQNQLDSKYIAEYNKMLITVTNHLEKEHKLIREGHYIGMYMPLGVCFGVTFGIIFNNISIGISFGMLFGVAIGSLMDADAKKKGKII